MGHLSIPSGLTEAGRLSAVAETGLLDGPPDPALDRYTRILREAVAAPVALVSLVDDRRQFFSSGLGLSEPWATTRETPLSHSFCQLVVVTGDALVVEDARHDGRVCGNGAITDLGVIAYAGMPITTEDGFVLGSFCAIHGEPHRWSERELSLLRDLAACVSAEVDLRRRLTRAERSESDLATVNATLTQDVATQSRTTDRAIHDLRTPLSVLSLGIQNLRGHEAATTFPELSRMLDTMQRNVAHACSLIEEMHDSTRPPGRAHDATVVRMCQVAAEVVDDLGGEGRAQLAYSGPPDGELALVQADRTAARRCVENLVNNAKRFARGRVQVSVRRREQQVEVAVDDDGPGLPDREAYRHVFEPRVRYHMETGQSGSGLGLAIVQEILHGSGGHAAAEPSALGGARFVLSWPAVTGPST